MLSKFLSGLKIAVFASAFHPHAGGVEELCRQLAHDCRARGIDVIFVTNRWPRSMPAYEHFEGVSIHRIAMRTPDAGIKSQLIFFYISTPPPAVGAIVLGRIEESRLAELYRKAWVFCLPSSYEGFGVPYIEAMASGTAVVATPNPGANEVLAQGQYGRRAEPEALGDALVELLKNRGERERLEALGVERAQEFSWERVTEQYAALYRRLAAPADQGAPAVMS